MNTLRGRVVLLLDDDLSDAQRIVKFLRLRGADVLGPVPSVAFALEIIQTERLIDYAIVDRTLSGLDTYAVADELMRREVPFLFVNGAEDADLPPEYRHIRCRNKPLALPELAAELLAGLKHPPLRIAGATSAQQGA